MKQKLGLIATAGMALLLILLVACGGTESATTTTGNATTTSAIGSAETTTATGPIVTHATAPSTTLAPATTTTEATTTTTEATTTTTVATAPKFGDTVEYWDQSITLGAPKLTTGEMFQNEDKDLYVFLVTIVNNGSEARPYNTMYFECQDMDSFTYSAIMMLEEQDLGSGELQPGKTVKGYTGFEVPKGSTIASVTYEVMSFGAPDTPAIWEK